ncbi:hypothetical protein [Pseudoalteromonas sp. MEBiC 03485]|uniref:hypothetical protein n=1 Tax=Pseudoalteromonas sp. MEBiC 03485 TaxID=2571103 RepID=UPI00102202B4|nr:hypothetical protein [Pseudoalteromonas sp. MEBiC 03485]RZD19671.1 hypothetical protein EVU92_20945 [Pseudoalteromonas sp. MEBiC 03485]
MEMNENGHKFNKTFKGLEGYSHFNACVGNNGAPDLPYYADGFLDAAYKLGEMVVENYPHYSVDEFIYPIGFNLRHSIELWLMHFIKHLRKIRSDYLFKICPKNGTQQTLTQKNMEDTHSIVKLWEWWLINSQERDSRLGVISEQLKEFIEDISEIDPTGQTFRYPYSTESEKHLVKTPIINVLNLTMRIGELRTILGELNYLLKELEEEYDCGTFTKTLSRAQISTISESLPSFQSWKEPIFKEAKASIKESFKISNSEFNNVINIIKTHRSFAYNIGIHFELKAATFDNFQIFLDAWLLFHPDAMRKRLEYDYDNPITNIVGLKGVKASELYERLARKAEVVKEVHAKLSVEAQADFSALFYLAHYNNYCEDYDWLFEREMNAFLIAQNDTNDAYSALKFVLEKANYIQNLSTSLHILKHSSLLKKLKKHYEGKIIFD